MQQTQSQSQKATSGLVYIVAWILSSILLILNVLVVRQAALDVMTSIQGQQIQNSAEGEKTTTTIETGFTKEMIDRWLIIGGGIAAVGLSVYFEYFFRKGREKGILWKRIGKVFGILIGVLLISLLIIYFV